MTSQVTDSLAVNFTEQLGEVGRLTMSGQGPRYNRRYEGMRSETTDVRRLARWKRVRQASIERDGYRCRHFVARRRQSRYVQVSGNGV